MSVRTTEDEDVVALVDSVTGWAFGPTFETQDHAESFLRWLEVHQLDARQLRDDLLERQISAWQRAIERETWAL